MDNLAPLIAGAAPCRTGVIDIVSTHRSVRIDLSRRYTLPFGIRVIPRAADCVQIGTDAPRSVLLRGAPRETLDILGGLDGMRSAGDVLVEHSADPLVWNGLLEQLLAANLLVVGGPGDRTGSQIVAEAHLTDERAALVHRHGDAAAVRILQARDDALIVVRGTGPVASSVGASLAASGVGHLHQQTAESVLRLLTGRSPTHSPPADKGSALRAASPSVRVHVPAAHQHPTLVVLTGDEVPDLGLAAMYVKDRIPHLPVTTGAARTVVGPLVLPGRSCCLSCAHRHRVAADPEWPGVARRISDGPQRAPAFLAAAATCLVVAEVLDHVDGMVRPRTVNGTLEWRVGDVGPRRRSWSQHPDCGCRGMC